MENFLFDLDRVKLEIAPDLGKKALARLNLTGGRITHYKIATEENPFERNNLLTKWSVSCQQGRKSGTVMYDLDGNEIKALGPR